MSTEEQRPQRPERGDRTMAHRFEHFEQAALRAEVETGRHEATEQAARTNVVIRLARMALGTIVLVVGILMIPLPGPGWLAVAAGLAILSKDVAWADRLLRYVRRRIPGVPEDGSIPRSAVLTAAVLGLAGVAASIWWYTG